MVLAKSGGGGGFALTKMLNHLMDHLSEYRRDFLTATGDVSAYCAAYITGLVRTEAGKRNLERINEELDMSDDGYQRMQQFISDSPWSATGVSSHHAVNTSDLYAAQPGYRARDVGYMIDESAHRKKGRHSVGVGRQYAGVIGKVDNCQVGVYASLVWRTHSTLINCRLFLPESWTSDAERCDRAGIPPEARVYKTKQELALEMLDADIKLGVEIDWVGGDALYGHGTELGNAIENRGLTFMLDVHCNQQVFTSKPTFIVPERTSARGRAPSKAQPDLPPVTVSDYRLALPESAWQSVTVRDGTKGPLTLSVHAARIWVRDSDSDTVRERVLVISRNLAENKIKYSLSNVNFWDTDLERLAYMQAQRYWVERAFQEAKSELGMSDYQVRKWTAWHHHMALVMLALGFIVKERITAKADYPLLSCRDVRLLIIALLLDDPSLIAKRMAQMTARHEQRQHDIARYYQATGTG